MRPEQFDHVTSNTAASTPPQNLEQGHPAYTTNHIPSRYVLPYVPPVPTSMAPLPMAGMTPYPTTATYLTPSDYPRPLPNGHPYAYAYPPPHDAYPPSYVAYGYAPEHRTYPVHLDSSIESISTVPLLDAPFHRPMMPPHSNYPSSSQKRKRRRYEEIDRIYACKYDGCDRSYGTLNHLNTHVALHGHGEKRTPKEFQELRRRQRMDKRMRDRMEYPIHPV
jgi:hypothetical protein